MRVSIIAAMSLNRIIGKDKGLPWYMPTDLKYFKEKTLGHAIVTGRKTFETVGFPLPKRRNVVVTRQKDFTVENVEVVHSINEALDLLKDEEEVFIAGGGEIYRQSLDSADRIYLTIIHHEIEGDTFFPEFDETKWILVDQEDCFTDKKNRYDYSFLVYERKRTAGGG